MASNSDRTTVPNVSLLVSPGFLNNHLVATIHVAWAEDRALLGNNPSAVPGAKIGDRGDSLPPHSLLRDWHDAINPTSIPYSSLVAWPLQASIHAAARSRHSQYVFCLLSICQTMVANLRITATRAMEDPRRRLIRLNHSRNRASLRKA